MIHRKFGSSTAARTNNCPAWVAESEGIESKESVFAMDGTIIHEVAEAIALDETVPDIVEGHRVTKDHIEMAEALWAEAQAVMKEYKMTDYEPEVHATTADDVGGTLDLVAWNESMRQLMLLDYKSGRGVQVEAEDNEQILFIASQLILGDSALKDVTEDGEFVTFIGVILQPDSEGIIQRKVWPFTIEDVTAFWKNHSRMIARAREGLCTPKAGDHCKFCPANGLCDATTGNLLRMAQLDPDDLDQLKWALDHIEQVKKTIANVEKLAFEQLELGAEIPGWKLVRGRAGNLSWIDENVALARLKRKARGKKDAETGRPLTKAMVTQKVITPTQAKKILLSNGIDPEFIEEDLAVRPAPKNNVLAPESDKRQAVVSPTALEAALNSVR